MCREGRKEAEHVGDARKMKISASFYHSAELFDQVTVSIWSGHETSSYGFKIFQFMATSIDCPIDNQLQNQIAAM